MPTPEDRTSDDLNARGASTLYCDDVRQEVSRKLIYIGVYGERLVVERFPVLIPGLVVVSRLWWSPALPLKTATIRVTLEDTVLAEESTDLQSLVEELRTEGAGGPSWTDPNTRASISHIINLAAFGVDRPGTIRTRIHTDVGEFRTQSLQLMELGEARE